MKTKDELREYNREYRRKNKSRLDALAKVWRNNNRERYNSKRNARRAIDGREYQKARERNYNKRLLILNALGCKCTCCGETAISMLDIDHVNNDGKQHREERGQRASYWVYNDVIRSGFDRSRYQVLCRNCNWSKWKNSGVCEHIIIFSARFILVA